MKFVDEVVIELKSGDGGPGAVHFMRQKCQPKMGPDGGDGGRGGDVYFMASPHMQSLLDFKYSAKYHANNGQRGMGNDCNGRDAEDLVVKVPIGTTVRNAETGDLLVDLVEPDVAVLVLKGGRGGLGNMNFATSTRQAPDFAQPGLPGSQMTVSLELKLLADVGLVGFPNAGKSTLISRMSSAKPKIADYPFTTLVPNLGVVRGEQLDFVMADIPGIIEGASEGRGLGVKFLKHCERTRVLIVMLDANPMTGRELDEEYNVLIEEMGKFSRHLLDKPRIVAINKMEAFQEEVTSSEYYPRLLKLLKKEPLLISAASGLGIDVLKREIEKILVQMGPRSFTNTVSSQTLLGNQELFDDAVQDD